MNDTSSPGRPGRTNRTDRTSGTNHPGRTSRFRSAPLPEAPPAPLQAPSAAQAPQTSGTDPERSAPTAPTAPGRRSALLEAQRAALGALVKEDLSRGRAAAFVVCALVLTVTAGLVPVLVLDAVESADAGTGDATDVAVTAVLACVLLAVFAVPALLVLRSLRVRGLRRAELLRAWAAVDRGADADFPRGYGSRGYPHARFFIASTVLALSVILAVAVPAVSLLAEPADRSGLALLPCLLTAGALAWSTVAKYARRYGWAAREQLTRARARRRDRHRVRLTAPDAPYEKPRHDDAWTGPAARIRAALQRRGRTTDENRDENRDDTLPAPFTPEAGPVHPVRHGLGEPLDMPRSDTPPPPGLTSWDLAPTRKATLAVRPTALHLHSTQGAAPTPLALPLTDVLGAALIPSPAAWLDPSVDVLLHSGEAVELRSPDAHAILDELSRAGIRVLPT